MPYKLYRRHKCERKHRTWNVAAKCIWPRASWITGEGKYALIAYCHSGPTTADTWTITLWSDPAEAEKAKAEIDRSGCGGGCVFAAGHEIVELHPEILAGPAQGRLKGL